MLLRKARGGRTATIIGLAMLFAAQTGNLRGAAPASAEQVLQEARQALNDGRWDDAARAVAVAEKASEGEQFQRRVAVCRRELFTVVRLDELRYEYPTNAYNFDREALSAAYRDTFRGYGLDPEKADDEMKRRGRASPIRAQLVAALDDWARIFRVEDQRRNRLVDFADALDNSELRKGVRAAVRDSDVSRLHFLATVADVKELMPATLLLLERTLGYLGDWQTAEQLLRRGREELPPDFWILLHLGEHLANDKTRAEEGARCLCVALAMRPDSIRAQCALAESLCACKRYVEAEAVVRDVIRARPQWMEAHWALVRLLDKQGKHAQADAVCREAVRLNRGNAAAQCLRGRLLNLRCQWGEAEAVFREVLRFEPDNAEAMAHLGYVLAAQKKYREAESVLREALRRGAEWYEAPYALGMVLVEEGQDAEGEARLREYLRYNSDDPDALVDLARAHLHQDRALEADLVCREALRIDPDNGDAKYYLGRALLAENLPAEAEALFREMLRVDDADEEAWSSLGVALAQQEKLKEAEAHYRAAAKRFPKSAQLHNDLGGVLAMQNRFDEAEPFIREALRLNRDHVQARSNLIGLLRQSQRYDEALAILRDAVSANNGDAIAWTAMAEICSTLSDYAGAEPAARALVRLTPDSAPARCNLALALEFQGRFAEALVEVRQLKPEVVAADRQARFACERLEHEMLWERQLSAILCGELTPTNAAENLAMGRMCLILGHPAAALRLFEEGRRQNPQAFADAEMCYRSLAAAAAIQVAAAKGDGAPVDDAERGRLRRQALAWMREEFAFWSREAEEQVSQAPLVDRLAAHWQQMPWLDSVRGDKALAQLPADEREGWAQLWRAVEVLRRRLLSGRN